MFGYDWTRTHALLTAFPVALLSMAVFFEVLAMVLKKDGLRRTGFALLLVGTLGAGAAVLAGRQAEESVAHGGPAHELMEHHEKLAYITLGTFAAVALWRLLRRQKMGGGRALRGAACLTRWPRVARLHRASRRPAGVRARRRHPGQHAEHHPPGSRHQARARSGRGARPRRGSRSRTPRRPGHDRSRRFGELAPHPTCTPRRRGPTPMRRGPRRTTTSRCARASDSLSLAAVAACQLATARPPFEPFPEARHADVSLSRTEATERLAEALRDDSIPVTRVEPRDGYVETPWFSARPAARFPRACDR